MRAFTLVCLSVLLVVAAAAFPLSHSRESRHSAPVPLVVRLQGESMTVPAKPRADDALLPPQAIVGRTAAGHFHQKPAESPAPMGSNHHGSGAKQTKWLQKVDYRRDLSFEDLFDGTNYEPKDSVVSSQSAPSATTESSSTSSIRPSSSSATQRIAVSKEKSVDGNSANRWAQQDYDWR